LPPGETQGVLRDDWSDPEFWRWWWRNRVPIEVKIGAGAAAALVMAVVGYVLAYGIASDAEASGTRVVETTVSRVVTVRDGSIELEQYGPALEQNLLSTVAMCAAAPNP